jgi:uncharacterized repeat protein (TIGR01451 family)
MTLMRNHSKLIGSLALLAAALSVGSLASNSAQASENAIKAEGQGPKGAGAGEPGKPVYGGGGGCSYAYSIQKIGQTYAEHDEEISYQVIVKNIGTCRLRHIEVADFLPHGMEYISASPAPESVNDGRIRWEDIDLKAGRYQLYTVTAEAKGHHERWETNQACAFTPWVGTRICDAESTWIYHHKD